MKPALYYLSFIKDQKVAKENSSDLPVEVRFLCVCNACVFFPVCTDRIKCDFRAVNALFIMVATHMGTRTGINPIILASFIVVVVNLRQGGDFLAHGMQMQTKESIQANSAVDEKISRLSLEQARSYTRRFGSSALMATEEAIMKLCPEGDKASACHTEVEKMLKEQWTSALSSRKPDAPKRKAQGTKRRLEGDRRYNSREHGASSANVSQEKGSAGEDPAKAKIDGSTYERAIVGVLLCGVLAALSWLGSLKTKEMLREMLRKAKAGQPTKAGPALTGSENARSQKERERDRGGKKGVVLECDKEATLWRKGVQRWGT